MGNSLYGNGFIEKLVSSGYKNPTYAMAEIIDNSIDAKADKIDIVLVEEIKKEGSNRTTNIISDVLFIDNGTGMNLEQLNGCLKFSEGAGTSNSRIGTFGVGLPNSSIFVGRRVEVYSKDKSSNKWHYVFLDLDDQKNRSNSEPQYDEAIEKLPLLDGINIDLDLTSISTIVRWSKIHNIGALKSKTVISRTSKLIGRIYRYKLDDVSISFSSIIKDNTEYEISPTKILAYDPLFLKKSTSYITKEFWDIATSDDPRKHAQSPTVPDNEEFNTKFHYMKYIDGCKENETMHPLFQKLDTFWDVKKTLRLGNETYSYIIRASLATKSMVHPGVKKGGGTVVGKIIREKMTGSTHFSGGNISFIRAKREVDCGHFGLYQLNTEKERFWTIEIEFDSSLDKLMGLDYQKQNVAFKVVTNEDLPDHLERSSELNTNEKQLLLFKNITTEIIECKRQIKDILNDYSKEFLQELKVAESIQDGEEGNAIQQVEHAVITALPRGEEWTEEQKNDLIKFLKKKYMSIPSESISKQVEKFSKGLMKTVVLYNADETGNLLDITSIRGKLVTFINTKHTYYTKIIEPLKENKMLNVFTTSIEMLLCSYAYEMREMVNDDDRLESTLTRYLRRISDRLESFIVDGKVSVDTKYWQDKLADIDDQEESDIG